MFETACSACGACLPACPEAILVLGEGGLPEVDFARGECSFCGACAEACPEPAFEPHRQPPWHIEVGIQDNCLTGGGVVCQSCGDACPEAAICFPPRLGTAPKPMVEHSACSGCGACVSACPVSAVRLVPSESETDRG